MKKNKIIQYIVYIISLALYFVFTDVNFKLLMIFIISSILIINISEQLLNKKSSFLIPVINLVILVLVIINFMFQPFTATKKVNAKEYISFVKDSDNKIHKLNGKLSIIENNGIKYVKVKAENSFINKKEYAKDVVINNMKVNILNKETYKTGNYLLYIKNNLTNENQEYILANNGDINLNNNVKIKMLNKSDNFKNAGKAIQVEYKYPQSKRNYRQWLFKENKEFNLSTSSDDPITLLYANDEINTVYNIKISFTPPYQKEFFFMIILLSLVFLITSFLKLKNENKLL